VYLIVAHYLRVEINDNLNKFMLLSLKCVSKDQEKKVHLNCHCFSLLNDVRLLGVVE